MSAAPFSTLLFQSADAGVPGGATKISADAAGAGICPTDERIAGHDPAAGPSTANVPPAQNGATVSAAARQRKLFRKCIPDPCAEIVEVRPVRIAFVDQINSVNEPDGDRQRRRRAWRMETKSRTRFDEIRPVLALHVEGEIAAPERLDLETAPKPFKKDELYPTRFCE